MSRTIIDLKDDLIRRALKLTGLTKKSEILNLALEYLIQQKEVEEFHTLNVKGLMERRGT